MRSLVVVALLVGCGSQPQLLGDGGIADGPSHASLSIEPSMAEIGSLQTAQFTVTNEGSDPTSSIVLEITGGDSVDFAITRPSCTVLAPGNSCMLAVYSFGRTADAKAQLLAFDGTDPDVSATADLSSSGDALAISVPNIPGTPMGGVSDVTVTITNPTSMASGPLALQFTDSQFGLIADATGDQCTGKSLASGEMCTFDLEFEPNGNPGSTRSTTITASGPIVSGQTMVTAPVVPLISVDQTTYTGTLLSCALPPQGAVFTYTNNTGAPLTSLTYAFNGGNSTEFVVSHDGCSQTLGGGQSCQLTVSAASLSATGAKNTTLEVTAMQGSNVTQMVKTALGISFGCDFIVSPLTIGFSSVPMGSTSVTKPITIMNTSTTLSHVVTTMVSGTPVNDFILMDPCNNTTLAPGGSCTIMVAYRPSVQGSASEQLVISTVNRAPYTVSLSGNGIANTLTFTPPGASFMQTAVGSQSPPVTFTLKSTVPTGSISIGTNGPFMIVSNNCTTLDLQTPSCAIAVVFAPQNVGTAISGSLVATTSTTMATAPLGGNAGLQIAVSPSYATLTSSDGLSSMPMVFTVTNLSGMVTGALAVQQVDPVATGFVISNGCTGMSLQSGSTAKCTFTVSYQSMAADTPPVTTMISVTASPGGTAYAQVTGQSGP